MKISNKALYSLGLLLMAPNFSSAEEKFKTVGIPIPAASADEAPKAEVKEPITVAAEPSPAPTPSRTRVPRDCPACGMG